MAVSGLKPMPLPALQEVLLHRKLEHVRSSYLAHLIWLAGAQLFALGGGRDYPVPDVFTLFPDCAAPRDRRTASDICRDVLSRLTHPRKERDHGQAV